MRTTELPVTLWNGSFLDGILTITTNELPAEDEDDEAYRTVYCTLIPASQDMTYTVSCKINNTHDSLKELLNSITYEYVELVQVFKDRELESGTIRLH